MNQNNGSCDAFYTYKARCMLIERGRRRRERRDEVIDSRAFADFVDVLVQLGSREELCDKKGNYEVGLVQSLRDPSVRSAGQLLKETVEWMLLLLSRSQHCQLRADNDVARAKKMRKVEEAGSDDKLEAHYWRTFASLLIRPTDGVIDSKVSGVENKLASSQQDNKHSVGIDDRTIMLPKISMSINAIASLYHVKQEEFIDFLAECVDSIVREPLLATNEDSKLPASQMKQATSAIGRERTHGEENIRILLALCSTCPCILLLTLRILSIWAARCDHIACLDLASLILTRCSRSKEHVTCSVVRAMSDRNQPKQNSCFDYFIGLLLSEQNWDNASRIANWIEQNEYASKTFSQTDIKTILPILGWRWLPILVSMATTYQVSETERKKFACTLSLLVGSLDNEKLYRKTISCLRCISSESKILEDNEFRDGDVSVDTFTALLLRLLYPAESRIVNHAGYLQTLRVHAALAIVCQRYENRDQEKNSNLMHVFLKKRGLHDTNTLRPGSEDEELQIKLLFLALRRMKSDSSIHLERVWAEALNKSGLHIQ